MVGIPISPPTPESRATWPEHGLTLGLTYGPDAGDPAGELPRLLAGALVQLPAVWIPTGARCSACCLGSRPLSWVALVMCLMLGQLGEILRLERWVLDLSPFTHLPKLPGGEVRAEPLIWLVAVGVAFTAAGLAALRHRSVR